MTGPRADPPKLYPHPELPDEAYRLTTIVLRVGLGASLTILIGAIATYLLLHPNTAPSTATSSNPILQYLSLGGLAHGLSAGAPVAFLTLGIYVLIASPIARVVVGTYYFHRGREKEMTAITLTVLALLLLGIFVLGPLIR